MPTPQWIVAQIGAREHYAAARAMHRRGQLDHLFTDAWAHHPLLSKFGPGSVRALAGRRHPDIPSTMVTARTLPTVTATLLDKLTRRQLTAESEYRHFAEQGKQFASWVTDRLEVDSLQPGQHAYFGYDTGCLETLQALNRRGIFSIVDQIDPARTEEQMVREETERWPDWGAMPGQVPELYWERLAGEWEAASVVLVNSPWSKAALVQQNVPAEKIIVVPLAYEPPDDLPRRPANPDRPLTVLWLGSVILRKGIPYFVEAARKLADRNIRFVVAGPVGVTEQAVATFPDNIEVVGRIDRSEASDAYRHADVFALPTVSDGFAITQLEAMAHGLPVIATPNCGQVVTDGVDGRTIPARDGDALAEAIAQFDEDRDTLETMSEAAIEKSKQFGLDRFADSLNLAFAECKAK